MRKYLVVLVALSLVSIGSTAAAEAPEFPDFIPMQHGPEGVVVDNVGNVFVSVGVFDSVGVPGAVEIWRFSPSGEPDLVASMPAGPGQTATGMAMSPNGKHLFVGVAFGGVYEISSTGDAELVPGTDAIALPNSLAFDQQGNLYITETFSFDPEGTGLAFYPNCTSLPSRGSFGRGGIWVVPKGGEAELLLRHDLLTGLCLPNPIPYPIGANGLAWDHGSLIVANTEKALLLEIDIGRNGELGEPRIISRVQGVDPVFGPWLLDGLALDVHGDIYVAAVTGLAVVKVERDGSSMEVLGTSEDDLDFPASLAFGTGKGERQSLFVTNLSLGGSGFAGPGVVKIDAGSPGMPLP